MVRNAGFRFAAVLGTLVASSFLIYASLRLAPGDPVSLLSGGRTLSPAAVAALRHEFHLDQGLVGGYLSWVSRVVRGDFGRSMVFGASVATLLVPRIATTAFLIVYAGLLTVVGGILLGVVAGLTRSRVRLLISLATATAMAIPGFVAAVVLVEVFAVKLGWFPVSGAGSGFVGRIQHLTLPAIALATAAGAYVARLSRSAIQLEASREHVTTATGRGISRRLVIRRHILRNAMIPITTVSGVAVASLLAGDAIIEQAFQINGIGGFLIQAVTQHDFAVVQAICLIVVVAFILINGIVDALYVALDPRLRVART